MVLLEQVTASKMVEAMPELTPEMRNSTGSTGLFKSG